MDTTQAQARELAGRLAKPARAALIHTWGGTETVILDSPPGAGKTEAISLIAPILAHAAGASVTVASPTVAGAKLIAQRIADRAPWANVALAGSSFARTRGIRLGKGSPGPGEIYVSTISSRGAGRCSSDIMIVDEAYQATALDVRQALAGAGQALLVGDPGQIGPVIPFDATVYDDLDNNPAGRAPDILRRRAGARIHHLEATWRLGVDTVDAVAPLYPFPFSSNRPATRLGDLPEILEMVVEAATVIDPVLMKAATEAARGAAARTVSRQDEEDRAPTVAIIATRNEQTSILASMVAADPALKGTVVGTADLLQGAEYDAVVAIDPLAGAQSASGHAAAAGRLCVMMTRHRAHLAFVTTRKAPALLDPADREGKAGIEVRGRIAALNGRTL